MNVRPPRLFLCVSYFFSYSLFAFSSKFWEISSNSFFSAFSDILISAIIFNFQEFKKLFLWHPFLSVLFLPFVHDSVDPCTMQVLGAPTPCTVEDLRITFGSLET